jgi:hypothetical protein
MIVSLIISFFDLIKLITKAISYVADKFLTLLIVCVLIVVYPILALVRGFDWLGNQARKLFVAIYYV